MTETRITDPSTGGQKGDKPRRYDLIPPDVLGELADHYGFGVSTGVRPARLTARTWTRRPARTTSSPWPGTPSPCAGSSFTAPARMTSPAGSTLGF